MVDEHRMLPCGQVPEGPLVRGQLDIVHIQRKQQIGKLGSIFYVHRGGTVGEYALTTVFHYGLCPNVDPYSNLCDHIGLTSIGVPDKDHIGLPPLESIKEHGVI